MWNVVMYFTISITYQFRNDFPPFFIYSFHIYSTFHLKQTFLSDLFQILYLYIIFLCLLYILKIRHFPFLSQHCSILNLLSNFLLCLFLIVLRFWRLYKFQWMLSHMTWAVCHCVQDSGRWPSYTIRFGAPECN